MKMDPIIIRGVVIASLAIIGLTYELFTDREAFVLFFYLILVCIGLFLIWKIRA